MFFVLPGRCFRYFHRGSMSFLSDVSCSCSACRLYFPLSHFLCKVFTCPLCCILGRSTFAFLFVASSRCIGCVFVGSGFSLFAFCMFYSFCWCEFHRCFLIRVIAFLLCLFVFVVALYIVVVYLSQWHSGFKILFILYGWPCIRCDRVLCVCCNHIIRAAFSSVSVLDCMFYFLLFCLRPLLVVCRNFLHVFFLSISGWNVLAVLSAIIFFLIAPFIFAWAFFVWYGVSFLAFLIACSRPVVSWSSRYLFHVAFFVCLDMSLSWLYVLFSMFPHCCVMSPFVISGAVRPFLSKCCCVLSGFLFNSCIWYWHVVTVSSCWCFLRCCINSTHMCICTTLCCFYCCMCALRPGMVCAFRTLFRNRWLIST